MIIIFLVFLYLVYTIFILFIAPFHLLFTQLLPILHDNYFSCLFIFFFLDFISLMTSAIYLKLARSSYITFSRNGLNDVILCSRVCF
ncbi:hypothetical protein GLYMA_03G174000v4 [Glycine max]|uniref:Uncharacterized protein n=2 Tax=Glycine subgen. Soja TaxID=1462606 RepID=A0A0R0KSD7_SOYBN|nr:hypothetical protein JHK87_007613 [Glycine soja]KRH67576.1 hypothetical protein GLYMA_03G174000v4 [Glycine max]RZC21167.1 hypothetical protein D0Y65_007448 [Glycine soja]